MFSIEAKPVSPLVSAKQGPDLRGFWFRSLRRTPDFALEPRFASPAYPRKELIGMRDDTDDEDWNGPDTFPDEATSVVHSDDPYTPKPGIRAFGVSKLRDPK